MLGSLMAEKPSYVQFEIRAVEDRSKLFEDGRCGYKDVDFAIITPAGTRDKIERNALEWLDDLRMKAQNGMFNPDVLAFYEKAYKAFKDGQEVPVEGTPIRMFTVLTPSEQKRCLDANIRTIEELATMHEAGLSRVGMGARELQNKAKAYLAAADGPGKLAAENAALRIELEDTKAAMGELLKRLEALEAEKPKKRASRQTSESEDLDLS